MKRELLRDEQPVDVRVQAGRCLEHKRFVPERVYRQQGILRLKHQPRRVCRNHAGMNTVGVGHKGGPARSDDAMDVFAAITMRPLQLANRNRPGSVPPSDVIA